MDFVIILNYVLGIVVNSLTTITFPQYTQSTSTKCPV